MRLVLMGAPGSGKGTQGALMSRRLSVPQIATGDILRSEIQSGTPLGLKANEFVGRGEYVSDELMLGIIESRLVQPDTAGGFILDGFPRTIPQAQGLDRVLGGLGIRLDAVVKLDVSKKVLIERMVSRRVCPGCAAVYNIRTNSPETEGVCDRCGRQLGLRTDDTDETVRKRLLLYEVTTAPLIDYYDGQGLLVIVQAEGKIDDVAELIERTLEKRAGKSRPRPA
jgi:adenylate kinase